MNSPIAVQRQTLPESYPELLAIESSGERCEVAFAKGVDCFMATDGEVRDHSAVLTLLVESVLRAAGVSAKEIKAVAVSAGPGSYTSLRIGLATAKGMAYAIGCPIIAVPTLEALASEMVQRIPDGVSHKALLPMIDARRMEVYTRPYSLTLSPLGESSPRIFDGETRPFFAVFAPALFGGPGAQKGSAYLEALGYHFLPGVELTAGALLPLALQRYKREEFASLAYLEPLYLKEFVALPSKKLF